MKSFTKILIANRAEIAVRIIRAAHRMSIKAVALYSQADAKALHVRMADESYCIGEQSLEETYLNVDKIIQLAKESGCQAIHPGYGFLAENPKLVEACQQSGIVFIGPSAQAIKLMGNKVESRAFVDKLGIPMTKAVTGSQDEIKKAANTIPLPILVKAAAGGGGKGMRIVEDLSLLDTVIEATSREALAYFGDSEVFIEQYIREPRHIEIQVLGDKHGNMIHLYERECSIQRRYQKIIEESPSPTLDQETREKMGKAAVSIAKAIKYDSAGTIEFLVDKALNFYFLEMNTRIQVEHPVTEMVTGVDLVMEQIRIAQGNRLSFKQEDIQQSGHAIEARIYAEEPENNFRPTPGNIDYYLEPQLASLRIDSALDSPTTIHSFFDPMIAKLIAYGENRELAQKDLIQGLQEYIIHGINTNIPFLIEMLSSTAFSQNKINTGFCDHQMETLLLNLQQRRENINIHHIACAYLLHDLITNRCGDKNSVWNKIGYWRNDPHFKLQYATQNFEVEIKSSAKNTYELEIDKNTYQCTVKGYSSQAIHIEVNSENKKIHLSKDKNGGSRISFMGHLFSFKRDDLLYPTDFFESMEENNKENQLSAPIPGKLIKIEVKPGDKVNKGDRLLIVEAMKMENSILAPRNGIIKEVRASEGEMVNANAPLILFEDID